MEKVSILIVNSSHASLDIVVSILREKISSEQRPHISCLSFDEIKSDGFIQKLTVEKLNRRREILEKLRERNEFNQLEAWQNASKKAKSSRKSQSCMLKRDELREIILDFPTNDVELYLVIFDVYDYDAIKSIALAAQNNLLGIVNLYPRDFDKICDKDESVKNELFWQNLMYMKFRDSSFENIAFLDLDVPVESSYVQNIRSQLLFDQFSYFLYDFDSIKSSFRDYQTRLSVCDVNDNAMATDNRELKQLEIDLNEIPLCMISVEYIYEKLIALVATNDNSSINENNRKSSLNKQSRKPFEIEAFGKRFYDMTDKWRCGYDENPKFYSDDILKLELRFYELFWCNLQEISMEKREVLNYFMGKIEENSLHHLEFYIYILEFMRWENNFTTENHHVDFYANHSVGHQTTRKHLKVVASDTNVDYKNVSRVPIEIEQLTDDRLILKGIDVGDDFFIQFYSKPSMLQRLQKLMEHDKNFQRQHFQLFDVNLLRFQKQWASEIFTSKSYKNVLPTPLCFRDFHDYMTNSTSMDSLGGKIAPKQPREDDGDKSLASQLYKSEDFLLETSIKRKLLQSDEKIHKSAESAKEMKDVVDEEISKKISVYNATNKFTEFSVNENEFNSMNFHVKAQIYNCLNCEKHLNLSCSLHDIHLSFSHDLFANNFKIATLQDEHTKMICSIDMIENRREMIFTFSSSSSFPSSAAAAQSSSFLGGKRMKIHDDAKSIEFDCMHGDESKRIFFNNGYVMIHMKNGNIKVYSPSGIIYEEFSSERRTTTSKRNSSSRLNQELTKLHYFSITSIHFLATFINISTYSMTLSSGIRYRIENDAIVDELRPTSNVREKVTNDDEKGGDGCCENLYMCTREDGLKILESSSRIKCLYPDGTLIVTSYDYEHLTPTIPHTQHKPLSILDEIWLKSSQIVLDDVVESMGSDYFLCIKRNFEFQHKLYGRIQFNNKNNNGGVEMEMNNFGLRIEMQNNCKTLISMRNGVQLRLNEKELKFHDEKCCECDSSNNLTININGTSKMIACANDIEGNSLEIQQQRKCDTPEVVFHKARKNKWKCRKCINIKREFNIRNFGECWVILNRDMTGYEIFQQKPLRLFSDEFIEVCDALAIYHIKEKDEEAYDIDDKDLHIDINDNNEEEEESTIITQSSTSKQKSQQSLELLKGDVTVGGENNKKKKNKNAKKQRRTTKLNKKSDLVIEKPLPTPSTWVTEDPSITADISLEQRQLIEFYVNPLQELPDSIDISAILKLNCETFIDVINSLSHLKKYCDEKFIINVRELATDPMHKIPFDENLRIIVQNTIEGYIAEKLEHYRCTMAESIVEDLLGRMFESSFEESEKSAIPYVVVENNVIDIPQASDAQPIPIKSFSFL